MSLLNIYDSSVREVVCVSNKDNEFIACDENSPLLEVGKTYTLVSVTVYDWKTEVEVEEFPDIKFNSSCFNEKKSKGRKK